ncbi:hypothetical protein CC85DRAFT_59060 [Cutaneotrichosporon oleaginosum]|uniref:Uncharacterized protein n=1 Tax=Cutaneotrichosporon oleaginosum TaxID=879819 RepID=A0A0J1BDX3_9TREE|nr:uncharacterized protein CC85DRAFT_59060 [Cutaneotrichosporon oleaginosum]KLT46274.1 hypothetical protein CC85DRAFT_59060 [Cutaneotrichosporon oleaginosum]TXT10278.1 hypothetical protein COLE_04212 [Cutaneotrichosporon oleaginosum]
MASGAMLRGIPRSMCTVYRRAIVTLGHADQPSRATAAGPACTSRLADMPRPARRHEAAGLKTTGVEQLAPSPFARASWMCSNQDRSKQDEPIVLLAHMGHSRTVMTDCGVVGEESERRPRDRAWSARTSACSACHVASPQPCTDDHAPRVPTQPTSPCPRHGDVPSHDCQSLHRCPPAWRLRQPHVMVTIGDNP